MIYIAMEAGWVHISERKMKSCGGRATLVRITEGVWSYPHQSQRNRLYNVEGPVRETMEKDISRQFGRLVFASLWMASAYCVTTSYGAGSGVATDVELRSEDKAAARDKIEGIRESGEDSKEPLLDEANASDMAIEIDQLNLPEDITPRFAVRRVRVSGNTLISTEKLFHNIPTVYNASDEPITKADSSYLYDFRSVRDVVLNPGKTRDISSRTIQGFTQYLLSVYQRQHYAGVYVRVAPDTVTEGAMEDDTLAIEVVEMPVSDVRISFFDVERNEQDEGYLNESAFKEWSPVRTGEVMNQKKLDDFINLLNLNPDRYVSATVSQGLTPQSIALGYDIFEINPWHYFIQVDNSGTDERQWNPKAGFINTNLTGRDDKLTAVVQAPVEKGTEDDYSIFGSYDVPLWTPRLRLGFFGARSEYEISESSSTGPTDFLGTGYSYGTQLRWNAFQRRGWFFDVFSSLSREKSEVTTVLFPQFLGSEVYLNMWGIGVDMHRRTDMASTSLVLDRSESIGGSSQDHFWDSRTSTGARRNTHCDFKIVTLSANHSQFLDSGKVQRLLGSFRYIRPDVRLVPAKMTVFGGMYSVRGYEENRIVADGGMLGSIQYEYDLVKKNAPAQAGLSSEEDKERQLQKLAPLVFLDYGRAETKDHVAGERGTDELCSLGVGMIMEYGEHMSAGIYYGHALRPAGPTDEGDGRVNIGVTMRF